MSDDPDITRLLRDLRSGEGRDGAIDALLPLLYDELRAVAGRAMRRERADHTLQPTALVHEAWLRLARGPQPDWQDRAHFLALAGHVMRQVLVDHARKHAAQRRGGDLARVTLHTDDGGGVSGQHDLLALHLALEKLTELDERTGRVAELRLFAGATVGETAEALGLSRRTVDDEWATARMWLARALSETP